MGVLMRMTEHTVTRCVWRRLDPSRAKSSREGVVYYGGSRALPPYKLLYLVTLRIPKVQSIIINHQHPK